MTAETDNPDPVSAIAALDEPKRRLLYELVAERHDAVGRDEAAAVTGMSRELASFHLDRLVAAGLLVTEFRRINDRRGPGAGRPAKLYRRSEADIAASFPTRRYERAASMFAEAIDRLGGGPRAAAATTLAEVARTSGETAGTDARRQAGRRPGRRRLRTVLLDLLKTAGYEPEVAADRDRICLRNCPYDALVEGHRDLTCGMNLAWAEGLVDGLGDADLRATLAPRDGFCCVVLDGTRPA
jgi:predicted ArsR family transcriptional regulator